MIELLVVGSVISGMYFVFDFLADKSAKATIDKWDKEIKKNK